MPTGTLMRNTQCQLEYSVMKPPSVGPSTGPTTTTTAKAANAMPRLAGGKVSARIDCSTGASPPPPIPWNSRASTSVVRLGETPHRNELTVNSAMEMRK